MTVGLKVYISSTAVDLTDYRMAVISAMRKSGFFPLCMEDYVAQDKLPVDKCLADVAACDLYIGIFAWRYGYVPPGFDKSITELEYRMAVKAGIPTLLFLLSENAEWPPEFCDTRQDAARISALREEMKLNRIISWFNPEPHQLASVVQSAANLAEREIHLAQRKKLEDLLAKRYAEVSMADTPEQKASLDQALALVQEAMRQQSMNAQNMNRDPIPIQLPKLRGTFVDREVERDTLFHCLRRTDKRLVVIVAPGGYGKTELTTKVLKEIAPGSSIMADDVYGILYIRCERGDVSLGQIFAEAGRIVGKKKEFCDAYADRDLTLARKLDYFFCELSKAGNVWLILDNFEDLLAAEDDSILNEELRQFLETAVAVEHNIRMIVTSRAVPRFKGSRSVEKIDLSAGLPSDQAILYLREEGGKYGLMDESDEVLRDFVQRVHCIPKALESVLGFLEDHYPSITLRNILSDTKLFVYFDHHDLENGLKSLVAKQFSNLSPDGQLILSAISIFQKPVACAALEYLLQGLGRIKLSLLLTRLEKNRLVNCSNGLYDIHPVVRSYVYFNIPEKHALNTKSKNYKSMNISLTFNRFGLHSKAADFFFLLRKPSENWLGISDIEPQLQEIYHLLCSEQYDSAAHVIESIDQSLKSWGHYEQIVDIRKKLQGKLSDNQLEAQNLGKLGEAYNVLSKFQLSIDTCKKALSVSQETNDQLSQSKWLGQIGVNYHYLGNYMSSIKYQQQALALLSKGFDQSAEACCLDNIGYSYRSLAYYEESISSHKQALSLYRALGRKNDEAKSLNYLGEAYRHTGNYSLALEYFQLAFDIIENSGHRRLMTSSLNKLGSIASYYGDKENAISYFTDALTIAREIGDSREEGIQLNYLGDIYVDLGNSEKAMGYYEQALSVVRNIKSLVWEGRILSGIGNAYISSNIYDKAETNLLLSLDIVMKINNKNRQLYAESKLVELYLYKNELSKALDILESVYDYKEMGFYHRAIILSAIVNARSGQIDHAIKDLHDAIVVADNIIEKSPQFYSAYYTRGLAHLVLSIILVDEKSPLYFQIAQEDYLSAVANCSATGTLKDATNLLNTLKSIENSNDSIKLIGMLLK